MKQPIHILYLSGFGMRYDAYRLRALRLWRFKNVTVELVPMRWESKETFEQKCARVDQAIDRAKGRRVVLLGESAAGGMVVYAYARRADDLYRVMTLCGKNSQPETVSHTYFQRSPAFRSLMEQLNESITALSDEQKKAFVSIHPLYDETVPVSETLLPGCKRVHLWSAGHLLTITLALTLFSPVVVRAAKE